MAKNRVIFSAIFFIFSLHISAYCQTEPIGLSCSPEKSELLVSKITTGSSEISIPSLTVEECLCIALSKNNSKKISAIAVSIAETQHKQALSSYWPEIAVNLASSRMDEDFNFIFPAETSSYTITGMTSPEIALGPGLPTIPASPLPPQSVSANIPEKKIKLMDRNQIFGAVELNMPIYTGGIRPALINQAKSGIEVAKQIERRSLLKITYDVKKMYYSSVLTRELLSMGKLALLRLKVTLDLTEKLYKKGMSSVNRTDYLKNKVMYESIRSMVATLESNDQMAKSALANTMGLSWNAKFNLSEKQIPFKPINGSLENLIGNSFKFNPDWKSLKAALNIAEEKIKEEKGGYFPKLMLTGTLWDSNSSYSKGVVSDENKKGWKVMLGMQVPIFSGFLTKHKVGEAKLRLNRIKEQEILLKEGLALQVNHTLIKMSGLQNKKDASFAAFSNARENRELNTRAYQSGLVETKDVLEAQLIETLMEARHQKALYDHAESVFFLDYLLGKKIDGLVSGDFNENS